MSRSFYCYCTTIIIFVVIVIYNFVLHYNNNTSSRSNNNKWPTNHSCSQPTNGLSNPKQQPSSKQFHCIWEMISTKTFYFSWVMFCRCFCYCLLVFVLWMYAWLSVLLSVSLYAFVWLKIVMVSQTVGVSDQRPYNHCVMLQNNTRYESNETKSFLFLIQINKCQMF